MDGTEKAKKIALNMLSSRMYTCKEMSDRLMRRGFNAETIEEVIGEISAVGLLDDREYAKLYLHDGISLNSKGIFRIKQELMKKGIARSIIDEAVDECEVSTKENLFKYAEERINLRPITTRHDLERFKAQLARRGYSPSEIYECLNQFSFEFVDE